MIHVEARLDVLCMNDPTYVLLALDELKEKRDKAVVWMAEY